MPQATTKKAPAVKAPATRPPRAAASRSRKAVDTTAGLSDDVLESVEAGQRAAIEAVRRFVASVDSALPGGGESPSRRQEIVDSALEMADRLVKTQYQFIREVIDSAGHSLGGSSSRK
jgi:hypothetical protein